MTLVDFNKEPEENALAALLDCCGSPAWADALLARRPLLNLEVLHRTADEIWWSLPESEWLAAFSKHPKIGEKAQAARVADEKEKPLESRTAQWSQAEQQGMANAAAETAEAIHKMNVEYERKFGWIFIVCATGRSAEEMRSLLAQRLGNGHATEIRIAAAEQAKITRLRLGKLFLS
jgi:2-oxo-4-hydroxy-4-carboxy-5-ureidoimidazoline decarboxylase